MKVLDIGATFGMGCGKVFEPWDAQVLHAYTLADVKERLSDVDLVVFGGGADVHPSLYGHDNVGTYAGAHPDRRDLFELQVFELAEEREVPMFGICRGAQFLCAMAGGTLIQDVSGHGGDHMIETVDGRDLRMTSTHHQMMYPKGTTHELLAWAKVKRSRHYAWGGGTIPQDFLETEVVFFPKIKAIAMQGHPEFFPNTYDEGVVYARELVNKYLLNGEMPNV